MTATAGSRTSVSSQSPLLAIVAGLAIAGGAVNNRCSVLPNGLVNYKLSTFYGPVRATYTVYEFQAHRADASAQVTGREVKIYGTSHCLKVTNQDAGGFSVRLEAARSVGRCDRAETGCVILWTTDPTAVAGAVEKAAQRASR